VLPQSSRQRAHLDRACGSRSDGRLARARLYVEPAESGGAGIDAPVRKMFGRP